MQAYKSKTKQGKKKNLMGKKKAKMLPRIAPKKVKKVGTYSNGIGVGP